MTNENVLFAALMCPEQSINFVGQGGGVVPGKLACLCFVRGVDMGYLLCLYR